MTHRFFVEDEVVDDVVLRGEQARQIATVLRLAEGDRVTVVREGVEALVRLDAVHPREVRGRVVERRAAAAEPRVRLTLAVPILRGERTEEVIEAATQLGASRIIPYVSSRSVVREAGAAKLERWRRIAREAAETARRGRVPAIEEPRDWVALLETLDPPIVVAWEGEAAMRLADALRPGPRLSLVVGPEGGLAAVEVDLARTMGAAVVTLGRRNLRSETAAIAAVAEAMAQLDR